MVAHWHAGRLCWVFLVVLRRRERPDSTQSLVGPATALSLQPESEAARGDSLEQAQVQAVMHASAIAGLSDDLTKQSSGEEYVFWALIESPRRGPGPRLGPPSPSVPRSRSLGGALGLFCPDRVLQPAC